MNAGVAVVLAARSLVRHRVRTLLAMLGIVIGIAAVICMVALGQGANSLVQAQINAMGRNLLMVWPGAASSGGFSFGGGTAATLTPDDGEAILREVPSVIAMTPVVRTRPQLAVESRNWIPGSTSGVNENFPKVRDWPLQDGDFFSERDVASSAKVCVIGTTIVTNLFPDVSPIGRTIRIKNIPFRVLGVLSSKGTSSMGSDQDDIVVMPWTAVTNLLQGSAFHNVDQLLLAVSSSEQIQPAMDDITEVLRRRHHLGGDQISDFRLLSMAEMASMATQTTTIMSALLAGIASISLIVGGIGIMNIMLVSVSERTREIGLRLAVGARGRDVLQQFLIEAVLLTGTAGLIGLALGAGVAQILASNSGWPLQLSPPVMALSVLFSCAVGLFFGIYPAMRASRLDPIEALRYE